MYTTEKQYFCEMVADSASNIFVNLLKYILTWQKLTILINQEILLSLCNEKKTQKQENEKEEKEDFLVFLLLFYVFA